MTGTDVQHLLRVLASLDTHLDDQLDGLSADPAVDEGRAALARLADPEHAAGLAGELEPAEAAWLAEEIVRRWSLLASPVLDPQACLVATEEPEQVRFLVDVVGLDPGWTVVWTGAEPTADDAAAAVWSPTSAGVTARVIGRGPGGRVVLVAGWQPPTGAGTDG
ncbi:MAG TPA: hypothetical protein VFD41_13100 [Actinomycetales bacterium]|nr:hypothetical protein [Actinomycetales bacterium]